jgi:isopentenyl diphosphate isomerase/L-lactate dehydrogenase-like FMN-dependent dehydrogenase
VSTEKAIEMMRLTKRQLEVTMFAAGAKELRELESGKLIDVNK